MSIVQTGLIRFMAKPQTTLDGTVIGPGTDLNMEGGLADNVKDMIILTAGSQAFSLLSNWLWLLLLLAPLRAFYMLWTSVIAPWIFQPAEEDDEVGWKLLYILYLYIFAQVSDKKRRKQERQMKRQMR